MANKLQLSAVILAGGDSKRMGRDKAFLQLNGATLVETIFSKLELVFSDIIIVTDCRDKYKNLPARYTEDLFQAGEKNSLRGIHAGLSTAVFPAGFVVACDMPFISVPLIKYMSSYALSHDTVVPRLKGYYQPLFAFYRRTTLNRIALSLEQETYKISSLYREMKVKEIDEETVSHFDPLFLSFFNINTASDYARAVNMLEEQAGCMDNI